MTQSDIAKIFGISQVTVSYALNRPDSKKCSRELRKKIREYCAKHAPELFHSAKSFQIALAIVKRKSDRLFYKPLISAIQNEVKKLDYQLLVTEPQDLAALYQKQKFDGLLTVGPLEDYSYFVKDLPEDLPQIMLNEYIPGIDINYFMPNYLAGHYQVIKTLQELGYQRISGIFVSRIGFPTQILHHFESEQTFLYCLREFGYSTEYCRSVEIPYKLSADLIPYFSEAIDSLLRNGKFPDAFFCGDGYLPYWIASLEKKGIKPFKDAAIIGFDNTRSRDLNISSLDFNFKEMGSLAVIHLYEEICSGRRKNVRVDIRPEFIIRNTLTRRML